MMGPVPEAPPQSADHGHHALSGAVRVVSGVTLLSRFGGLLREVLIARIFGNTPVGSAFVAGFAIPNMFRRLFGEGALSAAFIPEYTQTHKADQTLADRFASLTVLSLLAVTTALTVLIEVGLLVALLVLPHDADRSLSFHLIMLMLPYMPMVCAAAILGGMLQVHGRFGPASSGPLILNTFQVCVGLYFIILNRTAGVTAAYVLGIATVLSGVTQFTWFLRLLRPHVCWTRVFTGAAPLVRRMLRRFVPVLIGMGTLQINTFLDVLIAMWPIWVGPTLLGRAYPMDQSSNIILAAAQRLYQFPLGVFGIAVATAVFPLLSRHADEPAHFLQTLRRGVRLSLFIGLPASIGLYLVRRDISAVVYSGGNSGFDADGLARAAAALGGFAPGVWAYSLNHVFTRAFFAKGDTRTPMKVAVAMVGFNFCLNIALIWSLREAGLAWATSISAAIQCGVLALLCRRLIGGAIIDRETMTAIVRIAAAGAVMAVPTLAVLRFLPAPERWSGHLVSLTALAATGAAAYGIAALVLRCHELGWLLRRR
jgi:putative peptidoglycan lipid II flippase